MRSRRPRPRAAPAPVPDNSRTPVRSTRIRRKTRPACNVGAMCEIDDVEQPKDQRQAKDQHCIKAPLIRPTTSQANIAGWRDRHGHRRRLPANGQQDHAILFTVTAKGRRQIVVGRSAEHAVWLPTARQGGSPPDMSSISCQRQPENGAAKWNRARRTASPAAPAKALERPPHQRTKPIAARAGKGVASRQATRTVTSARSPAERHRGPAKVDLQLLDSARLEPAIAAPVTSVIISTIDAQDSRSLRRGQVLIFTGVGR